jgi:hypothetical protein
MARGSQAAAAAAANFAVRTPAEACIARRRTVATLLWAAALAPLRSWESQWVRLLAWLSRNPITACPAAQRKGFRGKKSPTGISQTRVSPGSKSPAPHFTTRDPPPARPSSSPALPAPLSSARVKLEKGWRWPAMAAAGCSQCFTPRSAQHPNGIRHQRLGA